MKEKNKVDLRNFRARKKAAIDEVKRRQNFSKAVIFGPIFTCSCCHRMLYENGVNKITEKFKDTVERKHPSLYTSTITMEKAVNITFNGSNEKTGLYICHTCKTAMMSGKRPSMAVTNDIKPLGFS